MTKINDAFEVVVIGGGAAGMMAAVVAARRGRRVCLLEKNERLGVKLAITGGGRCNIANDTRITAELLKEYGAAADFLQSPFAQFAVDETFDFFESAGLALVTEARSRAFPASHRATDVVRFLEKQLEDLRIRVVTNCEVKKVEVASSRVIGVETSKGRFVAESYVLATGGLSHPETGSTGDGFGWLSSWQHEVRQPTPSIVPVATKERWGHRLSGKAIEAAVWLSLDGVRQPKTKTKGRVLFTHFGLSGPTILNLASTVGSLLESGGRVQIHLDVLPGRDEGVCDRQLVDLLESHKNKDLKTALRWWLPIGLGLVLMKRLEIDPATKVHSLSKDDRKRLIGLAKNIPLTASHLLGFEKAVVADGGLSLTEIDMRTMRSKRVTNLLVVGDLLDINRPSGGYSLQLCWTTGFVAGQNA